MNTAPYVVGDKVRKYKDGGVDKHILTSWVYEVTEIHEYKACQSGWLMSVKFECPCCGKKSIYKDYDSDWFKKEQ